jgi:hypothetical protein
MTVETGKVFDIFKARNRIFHLRTQDVIDRYWKEIDELLLHVFDSAVKLASQNPNIRGNNFPFRLRQIERDFRRWLEEYQL